MALDAEYLKHNPNLPKRSYGSVGGWPITMHDDRRRRGILDLEDLDRPLYRVFPRHRMREVLRDRALTLVRPAMWDDPFENFLLRAHATLEGQRVSLSDLHDRYYGQCWTLNEESDAMWRIYSSDMKDAVKARTTVRRLFDAIYDDTVPTPELSFFLGLVKYVPQAQIATIMKTPEIARMLVLDNTGIQQVQLLLAKRYEFSHEAEVRLLFREMASDYDHGQKVRSFRVDPSALFDELVLDPRASQDTVAELTEEMRAHGYVGTVRQSELYSIPAFNVDLDDPGERQMGSRTSYAVADGAIRLSDAR
jgi:hypothetical protein